MFSFTKLSTLFPIISEIRRYKGNTFAWLVTVHEFYGNYVNAAVQNPSPYKSQFLYCPVLFCEEPKISLLKSQKWCFS